MKCLSFFVCVGLLFACGKKSGSSIPVASPTPEPTFTPEPEPTPNPKPMPVWDEYSSTVQIKTVPEAKLICTGVMVHPVWLLTSGRCLAQVGAADLIVESHDARWSSEVQEVHLHPLKLKNNVPVEESSDLALLRLKGSTELIFPKEQVSRISQKNRFRDYPRNSEFYTVGFGQLAKPAEPSQRAVRSSHRILGGWGMEDEEFLLAGPEQACREDFGGGVFDEDRQLVGIASRLFSYYMEECDKSDGILYTNLLHARVRAWIATATGSVVENL